MTDGSRNNDQDRDRDHDGSARGDSVRGDSQHPARTARGSAPQAEPNSERIDRDELLALAELEMCGMTDAVESARLERLFSGAVPSLQSDVLALQARLAIDPVLRSGELPPESLRLRTLARVAQAIDEEGGAAAPIATIGRKGTAGVSAGLAGAGVGSPSRDVLTPEGLRSVIDSIARERERLHAFRQPYWRAAAFFLLAALCVSIYFNSRYVAVSEKLATFASGEVIDSELRALATGMVGFDFGRAQQLNLVSLSPSPSGHVQIFTDASSGRIAVIGLGFAADETLEIVIRNPEGGDPFTHRFRVSAMGFGKVYDVGSTMARAAIVEIRNGDGVTLFRA
jgi:hypothetical protein